MSFFADTSPEGQSLLN